MGNDQTQHISKKKTKRVQYSLEELPRNDKLRASQHSQQKQVNQSYQSSVIKQVEKQVIQKQIKQRYTKPVSKVKYHSSEHFDDREGKLKNLTTKNDELRKQLIRISTELTTKLKKKKFQVKPKIQAPSEDVGSARARQSLKRQLQNAYKQIGMYKKTIEQMRAADPSEVTELKIVSLENQIAQRDKQIDLLMVEIQAVKTVTSNQSTAIKKDQSTQQALVELKEEIQTLKGKIRTIEKEERARQKKYMEQHNYMMALQYKSREVNGLYLPNSEKKNEPEKQKISMEEYQQVEGQLNELKIKHDQYHKKINNLMNVSKNLKDQNRHNSHILKQKYKELDNAKYRRDAFVKKIKDNLDAFVSRNEGQYQELRPQELSEFQSSNDDDVIVEEEGQKGTFDIEHLKSQEKPQVKEPKNKQNSQDTSSKDQPKNWKKMLTRVVSKGGSMPDEKQFKSGIKNPKKDLRIIMMNVWMNKKKQITAIQPVYLLDGLATEGKKSSRNHEDEYRVTYQLQSNDYLKSIIGIFGKSGFLDYMVLQSNLGKVSKIGRQRTEGTNFAIGVAREQTPIQIVGASSLDGLYWRINRLDVEVLLDMADK